MDKKFVVYHYLMDSNLESTLNEMADNGYELIHLHTRNEFDTYYKHDKNIHLAVFKKIEEK